MALKLKIVTCMMTEVLDQKMGRSAEARARRHPKTKDKLRDEFVPGPLRGLSLDDDTPIKMIIHGGDDATSREDLMSRKIRRWVREGTHTVHLYLDDS